MIVKCVLAAAASLVVLACGDAAFAQAAFLDAEGRPTRVPVTLDERFQALRYWEQNGFRLADANSDSKLSWEEWREFEWQTDSTYDEDRDQRISLAEYLVRRCSTTPRDRPEFDWCLRGERGSFRRFASRGFITRESMTSANRRTFVINDVNRDGFVTEEEQRIAAAR